MRFVFLFSLFIVFVSANVEHEISESSSFELPSDWSSIRSNIDTSFSCIGRAFGYYADVANDCQVYHVCQPRVENEITVYKHSPFICPLNTVFDQQVLACVHSTPEFRCANQVNYYAETENRLANVSVENVNPNVVSNNVVSPPERVEAPVAPVVEGNVVHQPIAERIAQPWSDAPALAVNVDLYGVQPSQILPAENAPIHNNVAPLITPPTNVRSNISAAPILNNHVLSNDESAEVSNVHPVSSVIGVVHAVPVHSRVSPQNQESLKMELPRNYEIASKSIALPITKRAIEHPVKAPVQVVKSQQVQQIHSVPVKAPMPVKAPQQQEQQVQKIHSVPVKAPEPAKAPQQQEQQVQQIHSVPVKAPMPVKAPQQQEQQVQQVHSVPVKAPMPVKAPQQQEQQVQQIHSVPVKAPMPVKAPQQQEQQVQQIQVPKKSLNNVAKQQYFVRSHTNLHNSQPSWRHHYVRLYPSLIHNNPYHVRHVARLV